VSARRHAARVLVAVAFALAALAGTASAQSLFDFVSFDGVDYIRFAEEPGRALTRADLGIEFATVECSIGEDARGCPFGTDAAAAFMPTGTRLYEVRGFRTEFRLAAVWRERIFLYQAWRSPKAKVGADLFDIAGKVRAIEVQRGEPKSEVARRPSAVTSPADTEALIGMILSGAVRKPSPHTFGEPRYWLTLWLTDGTTLGRTYFPESGELMGGIVVPADFARILERYLGE
jgi:hypothetical protein